MTTADKSQDEKTALLDEPEKRETAREVIFPALETTPTREALESLFAEAEVPIAVPQEDAAAEKQEPGAKTNKPTSGKRKLILLLAGLVIIAVGISIYFYLQNKPKPIPTPKSVDLPMQTSTSTSDMAETAFKISPEKQQLIGVQYSTVEYQTISKSLRAVGKVAYDETKITHINPKIEGWIENVYVDFTGKLVQKGQPLFSIYSPDLVQTQEEYLLAIKGRRQLGESPFPEAVNFSESLVQSARRRLELWDITDQQISELEKRGTPSRAMTVYAPASGFVTTRNAFPRQRVMPETELYAIADLSTVWILADIYEFEAADIKLGQPATVTLSSYPGREFSGKITYIYPQVDNTTRTLKVRVELANKNFALKPDMYADVVLNISYGRRLAVPQEAVMDSGSEQLVYVSLKDGYFEPRKIQVGAKADNKYVVLAGLKEGERVVTSGNFLIDSESRLKSASSGMGMPGMDMDTPKSDENSVPLNDQSQTRPGERKILYWYDAMNPAHHYNKPGKAPDGMDLVPKYADDK
jgi:membrane fusion protein, copper/silver efflux system